MAYEEGIFLRDGVLTISGISFMKTPLIVDVGDMKLMFVNCSSREHGGLTIVAGGGSSIIANAFGIDASIPLKRRWWKFW